MDEDSEKIDQTISTLAFGFERTGHKVTSRDIGGQEAYCDEVEFFEQVPPNPEFLKMLYNDRIGGPEDWC